MSEHKCSACEGSGCGHPAEWARKQHVARRRITGITTCRTTCVACGGSGVAGVCGKTCLSDDDHGIDCHRYECDHAAR